MRKKIVLLAIIVLLILPSIASAFDRGRYGGYGWGGHNDHHGWRWETGALILGGAILLDAIMYPGSRYCDPHYYPPPVLHRCREVVIIDQWGYPVDRFLECPRRW